MLFRLYLFLGISTAQLLHYASLASLTESEETQQRCLSCLSAGQGCWISLAAEGHQHDMNERADSMWVVGGTDKAVMFE